MIEEVKNIFLSLLFAIFSLTFFAQSNFNTFIDSLMDVKHVQGDISVAAINLANRVEWSYDDQKLLEPASIMKIITTCAALQSFGPDYSFRTKIGYSGSISGSVLKGDLIILAGGDPALGSSRFQNSTNSVELILDRWIGKLQSLGINEISGDIIIDQSFYGKDIAPNWNIQDVGNYYGAIPHAFTINDNEYDLYFEITGSDTKVKKTAPYLPRLKIDNTVKATTTKSDQAYIHAIPYNWNVMIRGEIPNANNTFKIRGSIPEPALYFLDEMKSHLKASGIKTNGEKINSYRVLSDSIQILDEIKSPPLMEIVRVTNHKSVNLYAEHLALQFGKKMTDTVSIKAAVESLDSYLSASSGGEGFRILDGSGLADGALISSNSIVKILINIDKSGILNFENSLPIAGVSGTLLNFGKGTALNNNLKAKSGYKSGVRSYAGYFKNRNKDKISFCIIANNFSCSSGEMKKLIEEILLQIYNQ